MFPRARGLDELIEVRPFRCGGLDSSFVIGPEFRANADGQHLEAAAVTKGRRKPGSHAIWRRLANAGRPACYPAGRQLSQEQRPRAEVVVPSPPYVWRNSLPVVVLGVQALAGSRHNDPTAPGLREVVHNLDLSGLVTEACPATAPALVEAHHAGCCHCPPERVANSGLVCRGRRDYSPYTCETCV